MYVVSNIFEASTTAELPVDFGMHFRKWLMKINSENVLWSFAQIHLHWKGVNDKQNSAKNALKTGISYLDMHS